jgi:hypothetical protein
MLRIAIGQVVLPPQANLGGAYFKPASARPTTVAISSARALTGSRARIFLQKHILEGQVELVSY